GGNLWSVRRIHPADAEAVAAGHEATAGEQGQQLEVVVPRQHLDRVEAEISDRLERAPPDRGERNGCDGNDDRIAAPASAPVREPCEPRRGAAGALVRVLSSQAQRKPRAGSDVP